jgi:hypothetical protein
MNADPLLFFTVIGLVVTTAYLIATREDNL